MYTFVLFFYCVQRRGLVGFEDVLSQTEDSVLVKDERLAARLLEVTFRTSRTSRVPPLPQPQVSGCMFSGAGCLQIPLER